MGRMCNRSCHRHEAANSLSTPFSNPVEQIFHSDSLVYDVTPLMVRKTRPNLWSNTRLSNGAIGQFLNLKCGDQVFLRSLRLNFSCLAELLLEKPTTFTYVSIANHLCFLLPLMYTWSCSVSTAPSCLCVVVDPSQ